MTLPKIPTESLGVVTLGAIQGITLFTTLLPDRSDIYRARPTPALVRDVRQGELTAALLTLGFSAMLSLLSRNAIPLWIGAATTITMTTAYEISLCRGGYDDGTL